MYGHLTAIDTGRAGASPPSSYDAVLHSYSLLVPGLAARIRGELAHLLDTSTGRFAELVVITQLLHSTTRGDNLELAEPLRNRAALLLGRTVPLSTAR